METAETGTAASLPERMRDIVRPITDMALAATTRTVAEPRPHLIEHMIQPIADLVLAAAADRANRDAIKALRTLFAGDQVTKLRREGKGGNIISLSGGIAIAGVGNRRAKVTVTLARHVRINNACITVRKTVLPQNLLMGMEGARVGDVVKTGIEAVDACTIRFARQQDETLSVTMQADPARIELTELYRAAGLIR